MDDLEKVKKLENLSGDLIKKANFQAYFETPKNHYTVHYVPFIALFESPENCSSQSGENAHIKKVKEAYLASNKKDPVKFVSL